jgi:hypothetical protein
VGEVILASVGRQGLQSTRAEGGARDGARGGGDARRCGNHRASRRHRVIETDIRLCIDVPVVVAEADGQLRIGHQSGGEAVGAVVLEIVHGFHVVAVFVDFDGSVERGPRLWSVCSVNAIALHLARRNAGVRGAVVSPGKVAGEMERVDGLGADTGKQRVLVNTQRVANRTDGRRRRGIGD